jgi:cytochrome c553
MLMRVLLSILILLGGVGCKSVADTPEAQLETKLQTIVTNCKSCHSTKEDQKGLLKVWKNGT